MTREFWSDIDNINAAKKQILDDPQFDPDELLQYLNFNDKIVLDFGCGVGRNLRYLVTTQARQIFGYDLPNMITMAFQFLSKEEIDRIYLITSLCEYPKVDIIIATLVFQHISNIDELDNYLKLLSNLLNRNGILYVHSRGYIDIGNDLSANRNVWYHILKYFDNLTTVDIMDGSEIHQRVIFKTKGAT